MLRIGGGESVDAARDQDLQKAREARLAATTHTLSLRTRLLTCKTNGTEKHAARAARENWSTSVLYWCSHHEVHGLWSFLFHAH
jgi:hypothetical protein